MSKKSVFRTAANELLNGPYDKVVFFKNEDNTPRWQSFTSGTIVSHEPDHVCEFHRPHYHKWTEVNLAAYMREIYYQTIE
jgi:hypothetical protein